MNIPERDPAAKAVVNYLARKLNVSRQTSESMPDAIAAIIREPREGLQSLFANLGTPLPKRFDEHVDRLSEQLAGTNKEGESAPSRVEKVPVIERERIEAAVQRALSMGIVKEEVFPAHSHTDRVGYLISSSHYGNYDFDPSLMSEDVKRSQAELFQLAHLLTINEVKSPIHVEGRTEGMKYTPFRGARPSIDFGRGKVHDIHHPDAQKWLFEHPDALIEIMNEHQKVSEVTGMSTPVFYAYAPNLNYRGAHTKQTETKLQYFLDVWMRWHKEFEVKWKFFFDAAKPEGDQRKVTVTTGWDGAGNPMLEMAGKWIYTSEIVHDMNNYLRYADALHEINEVREQEMAEFMLREQPETVPMAFAGKSHEFLIVERLRHAMEVRVLTPASSVRFDSMRRLLPVNDPAAKQLNIDMALKIRDVAANLPPRQV